MFEFILGMALMFVLSLAADLFTSKNTHNGFWCKSNLHYHYPEKECLDCQRLMSTRLLSGNIGDHAHR